ncbi:enoyl-CoA hydratase/isomerase family protein [Aeromicrobium sp. CFBP 8757]|uniref:enoyl-CoA hydratase/isomerase family protein n=1 Tax=Aeromicrobium sp. CFBP 8757 TaxID=2775288 RepID=UPI00177C113A|nr:enoyl-CoA hydratase/isomerase family protein [Aeromicrobium sp. CFBP 8757]MBD8605419.1 enoyl-CoA hydratase/isomerase family protein [Aeromicrobium sp. CFBP 8757]
MSTQITVDIADGIATVVMDGPLARNALDVGAIDFLADELARLHMLDELRCLILTGAGDSFCAGADLGAMQAPSGPSEDQARAAEQERQNAAIMAAASRVINGWSAF